MSNNWPFVKAEPIRLEQSPQLGLDWIYERIADDPEILGLGAIGAMPVRERVAGPANERCRELVMESAAGDRACAVVVKTGAVDEVQLVRAIEAWGRERAHHGQGVNGKTPVETVLVAEQVGARFLNVIAMLAPVVPIQAVQMQAIRVGQAMTVIFTPMSGASAEAGEQDDPQTLNGESHTSHLNGTQRHSSAARQMSTARPESHFETTAAEALAEMPPPDEPSWDRFDFTLTEPATVLAAIPDRRYWELRDRAGVGMADQLLSAVQALDPGLELDYHEGYIGLARGGEPLDFARFRPEPGALVVGLRLERNPLIELGIAQAGLEQVRDEAAAGGYALRLSQSEFEAQRGPASRLMRLAYEEARA